jgi:hypothetical protein
MPEIAHRARCRKARWHGEPPPRRQAREDAELFNDVCLDDPDAGLFANVRVPRPDAELFRDVRVDSDSASSLLAEFDLGALSDVEEAAPTAAEIADFVEDSAESSAADSASDSGGGLTQYDLPARRVCARCGGLSVRCACEQRACPAEAAGDDDGELFASMDP